MPKIAYISKNFRPVTLATIETVNGIVAEYDAQGFDLTLRQLYYQMVARGYIENSERSYTNFGSIVDDGRLAGLIDWDAIIDRTRNLRAVSHWTNPRSIISSAASSYKLDKWLNQPVYVEVWVEKEALLGVVERAARRLDIPWFACRGYVSQSEMWSAAQRFLQAERSEKESVVLHLGDHDPSGIDMTRDIQYRLDLFGASVEVRRLALNYDQIERYQPPPNPAKMTDSRSNSYVDRFGDESWELDALSPDMISDLINEAVAELRDDEEWSFIEAREKDDLSDLILVRNNWEKAVFMLRNE